MDALGNRALRDTAEKVRHGLPHPERLLSQEDQEPAEGKASLTKNRYKLYMNLERKREKTEENNLKAISLLFREVEEMDEKD